MTMPLTCTAVPVPPAVTDDDNAWVIWESRALDAGQDCREKLGAVKAAVDGWPK